MKLLKDGLSEVRGARKYVSKKVQHEPNSVEWHLKLRALDELVACHEKKLSSHKQELYSRYKRKYEDFRYEKLKTVGETKTKACADAWKEQSERLLSELREMLEVSERGREKPSMPGHSCPPSSIPIEGTHPRTTLVDSQKVSTPKTPNPPKQVQLTRSKASPSSVEPDPVPAPQGFNSSPPSVAHELPSARNPLEMGTPISSPPHRPSMRVKPVEQSTKTVLSREPPKGNSLMGIMPSTRIVSVPVPKCVNTRTSGKLPIIKTKVNVEKDAKARRHSPMPKAAPTLLKSTPVSSIRAHTPASSVLSVFPDDFDAAYNTRRQYASRRKR